MFDTQARQFWPTCLFPLPADVNDENRIQLAQRYKLHEDRMNVKGHVFMPLARLLHPPHALENNNNNNATVFILRNIHPDDNERVITPL